MGLFDLFKKQPSNSLDSLSEQKKMFLVNYLGDRSITWHIDEPVKERYPDIEQNIKDLQKAGLIKKEKGVYVLTESGQEMRKTFRAQERARREEMHKSAISLAMLGNYLEAYNKRARYERNSVIPHGIHISMGGDDDGAWAEETSLPYNVKNYIKASYKLDFSDCRNSEAFKDAMRSLYVGMQITGAGRLEPPKDFEESIGEYLDCPALDKQLEEKCTFPNPPKFRIYFDTKVRVYNFTNTGVMDHWDGQFLLGVFDCTKPIHASMSQYDKMKAAGIEGFPKTFQTFEKHKKANSEKYKAWIDEYSRIKGREQ